MRSLPITAVLLMLLWGAPALAQGQGNNGNGNGPGANNGNGNEQSGGGNGQGNANGNGNGNAGGGGPSGVVPGNSNAGGGGPSGVAPSNGNGGGQGGGNGPQLNNANPAAPGQNRKTDGPPPDQDEALQAVRAGEALPLATIVERAQLATGARVIDAKLVRIEGRLLYLLTIIDERGRVSRSYWYGRTGNKVQIR